MKQVILSYIPGYMFNGIRVVSTGVAIAPTQFIDKKTGKLMYYVRPFSEYGKPIGIYISHDGVLRSIESQ
jgi:hypothetical protein